MNSATLVTSLGQVVELIMGQAPPSKDCNREGVGTPFVKVGEFGDDRPVIREWTTNPLRRARKSDVLLCVVGATCGKINLGEDCAIGRSVAAIRPNITKLNQHYLHYFMMTLVERLRSGSVGAAQTVISKDMISSVEIPLPSLVEQQRIVAILDETFDGIATARANAERNLQNARAIFESHLQSVFTLRGDDWVDRSLGALAVFRNGINFTKSSVGAPIKILGVKDFRSSYWAPLDDLETVIPDGVLGESDLLQSDDLVFVRSNGNPELIGRCLLVGEVSEKITHSGFTIRARLSGTEVIPTYLCHFLKSKIVRREMIDGGNGANIRSLNQGTLSRLVIPVPPADMQMQIVARLEDIHSESQRLADIFEQKLSSLDELKKSLLYRAFSGSL